MNLFRITYAYSVDHAPACKIFSKRQRSDRVHNCTAKLVGERIHVLQQRKDPCGLQFLTILLAEFCPPPVWGGSELPPVWLFFGQFVWLLVLLFALFRLASPVPSLKLLQLP